MADIIQLRPRTTQIGSARQFERAQEQIDVQLGELGDMSSARAQVPTADELYPALGETQSVLGAALTLLSEAERKLPPLRRLQMMMTWSPQMIVCNTFKRSCQNSFVAEASGMALAPPLARFFTVLAIFAGCQPQRIKWQPS